MKTDCGCLNGECDCTATKCQAKACVSQRDAVLRERAAFLLGVRYGGSKIANNAIDEAKARQHFPLPRVTRPRVVAVHGDGDEYRIVNGVLETRPINSQAAWSRSVFSLETARAFTALLTIPTETVEDDA